MTYERSAPTSPPSSGRFKRWLARTARVVVRILLALFLGSVLGVALYWGAGFVYNQYVFPVQEKMIRLDVLTARQEQASQQVSLRLDNLLARLEALEVQGDTHKQALADLKAVTDAQATRMAALVALETVQADLANVQASLKAVQADHKEMQADLDGLHTIQEMERTTWAALQAAQDALRSDLDVLRAAQAQAQATAQAVEDQIGALAQQFDEQQDSVLALETELRGLHPLTALPGELQLVKAMELLTRSRLLLAQHNLGLAELDIQAAREQLTDLQSRVSSEQAQALGAIIARLDAAMESLPNAPVAAADELEGAWRLLARGMPVEATATPEPQATPTPGPTPTRQP